MEEEEEVIRTPGKQGEPDLLPPVTPNCLCRSWPLNGRPKPCVTEAAAAPGPTTTKDTMLDGSRASSAIAKSFVPQSIKCFRNAERHIFLWSPDRTIYRGSLTFCKDIHWHYPHIFHKISSLLNVSPEERNLPLSQPLLSATKVSTFS